MKRYFDWNPIENPILQNTILGTVLGIVIGINLKAIFLEGRDSLWGWLMFFLLGPIFGLLSGIERNRMMKKKV